MPSLRVDTLRVLMGHGLLPPPSPLHRFPVSAGAEWERLSRSVPARCGWVESRTIGQLLSAVMRRAGTARGLIMRLSF